MILSLADAVDEGGIGGRKGGGLEYLGGCWLGGCRGGEADRAPTWCVLGVRFEGGTVVRRLPDTICLRRGTWEGNLSSRARGRRPLCGLGRRVEGSTSWGTRLRFSCQCNWARSKLCGFEVGGLYSSVYALCRGPFEADLRRDLRFSA